MWPIIKFIKKIVFSPHCCSPPAEHLIPSHSCRRPTSDISTFYTQRMFMISPSDHWCELLSTLQINSAPQILIPLKLDLRRVLYTKLLILESNLVEYYFWKELGSLHSGDPNKGGNIRFSTSVVRLGLISFILLFETPPHRMDILRRFDSNAEQREKESRGQRRELIFRSQSDAHPILTGWLCFAFESKRCKWYITRTGVTSISKRRCNDINPVFV